MSEQVPGIGAVSDVPTPVENPSFEGLELAPEDWFVLSRVDGTTPVKDIVNLSPKSREETFDILRRLASHALIRLPGAGAAAAVQAAAPQRTARATKVPDPPSGWPTPFDAFVPDAELMSAPGPMDEAYRRLLLYFHAHLRDVTYYELLGLTPDAAPSALKKQYFRLSKTFHPDRFFRVDLGGLEKALSEVFRWLNEAHRTLSNKRRRAEYDALLATGRLGAWDESDGGGAPASDHPTPEASVDPSARPFTELIGEAKRLERTGDFAAAADLYEAALAQRSSAELMNRVAECLIRLKDNLEHAESRARGAVELAPDTARYHVALAFILELQSRTGEAIASYERALALDPNHAGARQRLARLQQGK